jgi:Uracil phosphoribosyltransferase
MAVEVLISRGVPEERILFLNLIASPEGVADFAERFPKLRVVTAFIDQGLDEKKYVFVTDRIRSIHADHTLCIDTSFPDWVILVTDIIPYSYRRDWLCLEMWVKGKL